MTTVERTGAVSDWEARLAALPPEAAFAPVDASTGEPTEVVVVLDDDPTGTQAVSGVPVLTSWELSDLRWALEQSAPAVFLSLNTRSLAPAEARARVLEATRAAVQAGEETGTRLVFASRSDSTLRGHYPLETDAIDEAVTAAGGESLDGVVIVPAFLESGRITLDSVHLMLGAEGPVPVSETEFARDRTFGYTSSDLRDWVEEKTAGRWLAAEVARITLADVRSGGVERVVTILCRLRSGQPVVVDIVSECDLALVAEAVRRAEQAGARLVYRVGPSFVRARARLGPAERLDAAGVVSMRRRLEEHRLKRAGENGLIVVGSHVDLTTRQLGRLLQLAGVELVELAAAEVVDPGRRDAAVVATSLAAGKAIAQGDVVIQTSRKLLEGATPAASLELARTVSRALADVVARLVDKHSPAWVVAKGGITSSDVGRQGLGIRRAWVRGSLLPGGVSLWEPVLASCPVPFAVFPGNVGDVDGLSEVVSILRGGSA